MKVFFGFMLFFATLVMAYAKEVDAFAICFVGMIFMLAWEDESKKQ